MVGWVWSPLQTTTGQNSSAHLHSCPTAFHSACWVLLQIWHPWVGLRMFLESSVAWWETTADIKYLTHTISGMGTRKSAEYLHTLPCGQGSILVKLEYYEWFNLEHSHTFLRLLCWSSIIWFVKVFNRDHQNHWTSTPLHFSWILEPPWVDQNKVTITATIIKSLRLGPEEVKMLLWGIVSREVLVILDTWLQQWEFCHGSA